MSDVVRTFEKDTLEGFVQALAKDVPFEGCGTIGADGKFHEFTEEQEESVGVRYAPDKDKEIPVGSLELYGRPGSKLRIIYRDT